MTFILQILNLVLISLIIYLLDFVHLKVRPLNICLTHNTHPFISDQTAHWHVYRHREYASVELLLQLLQNELVVVELILYFTRVLHQVTVELLRFYEVDQIDELCKPLRKRQLEGYLDDDVLK